MSLRGLQKLYQNKTIDWLSCPNCLGARYDSESDHHKSFANLQAVYCSRRCRKGDWKDRHVSECRGVLSGYEVERIEEKSAFVKLEEDCSAELVVRSLKELKFGAKLGYGAHGEVLSAVHRPTGKRVAVKKIKKKQNPSD